MTSIDSNLEDEPRTDAAGVDADPIVQEFDAALESGAVTFGHVVEAFYAPQFYGNPHRGMLVHTKYYRQLRQQYEKTCGGIRKIWLASGSVGGAVLTEGDDLAVVADVKVMDPAAAELGDECEYIHREAQRVCTDNDKRRCAEEAFSAITHILAHPKTGTFATEDERSVALAGLRRRVGSVRSTFLASAQRTAQIRYFTGTLIGIVTIAAVAIAFAVATRIAGIADAPLDEVTIAAAGGGIGAWVSVLYRFSFRKVLLDVTADPKHLRRLGIFRPVIGATFAVAVYCLLGSGIVPIEVPAAGEERLLFVGFAGFVSGFSERWAQDMLVMGETQLRGTPVSRSSRPRPGTEDEAEGIETA